MSMKKALKILLEHCDDDDDDEVNTLEIVENCGTAKAAPNLVDDEAAKIQDDEAEAAKIRDDEAEAAQFRANAEDYANYEALYEQDSDDDPDDPNIIRPEPEPINWERFLRLPPGHDEGLGEDMPFTAEEIRNILFEEFGFETEDEDEHDVEWI